MSENTARARGTIKRRLLITCFDTLLVACAFFLAVLLRYDGGHMNTFQWNSVVYLSPIMLAVYIGTMLLFKINAIVWRYAGLRDILKLVVMCVTAVIFCLIANNLLINYAFRLIFFPEFEKILYPRLVILFSGVIAIALLCSSRYIWILIQDVFADVNHKLIRRVLIIGANADGVKLAGRIRQASDNGVRREAVAFLDEDLEKLYRKFGGIPVEGTLADISGVVKRKRINEVILNTRDVSVALNRDAYTRALSAHCLPLIVDTDNELRPAKLENLLDSEREIVLSDDAIAYYCGKRVCVIGAATHVGLEVCASLAACSPHIVTLIDADEHNLSALKRMLGDCARVKLISTGECDARAISNALIDARPDVVIYLRALERDDIINEDILAAAQINLLGVRDALDAALKAGAQAFGYLSCSGAAQPESIGDLSRALAESMVIGAGKRDLRAVCARAEPVIESSTSMVSSLREQAIRDKRVCVRSNSSVSHISARNVAISIVNMLARCASGIYQIEPGDPIDEIMLARALVRSLGMEPDKDIEVITKNARADDSPVKADVHALSDPLPLTRVCHVYTIPARHTVLIDALTRAAQAGDAARVKELLETALARGRADEPEDEPEYEPESDIAHEDASGTEQPTDGVMLEDVVSEADQPSGDDIPESASDETNRLDCGAQTDTATGLGKAE